MSVSLKKHTQPTKGFTLIEALVAISVLLLSVGGPMAIAQKGIQNTVYARDQIVAFYLAQEGVELIRSIRDDNALAGVDWRTTISAPACVNGGGSGCGIDVDNMNFIDCAGSAGTACNLYYRASGLNTGADRGIYAHDTSGQPTIYSRSIKVLSVNSNEVSVDVTVRWLSRGTTKTITVQSRIFDQYNNI